jgi:hypothetical protein
MAPSAPVGDRMIVNHGEFLYVPVVAVRPLVAIRR